METGTRIWPTNGRAVIMKSSAPNVLCKGLILYLCLISIQSCRGDPYHATCLSEKEQDMHVYEGTVVDIVQCRSTTESIYPKDHPFVGRPLSIALVSVDSTLYGDSRDIISIASNPVLYVSADGMPTHAQSYPGYCLLPSDHIIAFVRSKVRVSECSSDSLFVHSPVCIYYTLGEGISSTTRLYSARVAPVQVDIETLLADKALSYAEQIKRATSRELIDTGLSINDVLVAINTFLPQR